MDRPSSPPRRTTFTRPVEEVPTKYRTLLEQPGLDTFDQIMVEHLGMEELYKLYTDENRDVFNQPTTLRLLAQRFKLEAEEGEIKTFVDLLRLYDQKYATVRSYHVVRTGDIVRRRKLPSHTNERILKQACEEGNIQAVIKGLKLYPHLRNETLYFQCWCEAVVKGHLAIVWFFFDLLAEVPNVDYSKLSLEMAARGGDLEIIKHLMTLVREQKDFDDFAEYLDENLMLAFREAIVTNQDDIIAELSKEVGFEMRARDMDQEDRDGFAEHAGMSGRKDKVELVFNLLQIPPAEEVRYYNSVLQGAAQNDHLALVQQIIPLTSKVGQLEAAQLAIAYGSRKVVQYLLENVEWSTQDLVRLIPDLIDQETLLEDVLERLEGKDWTLSSGILTELDYRKPESFRPLIRKLLTHATADQLRRLYDSALRKNNQMMSELTEELLSQKV